MGPWSKIDALRRRVAEAAIVEINTDEVASAIADFKVAPTKARDLLDKRGFVPDRLVVLGWEVILSRRRQDGVVRWHLSTKLHPHGRSGTKGDWEVVGRIAARVGAPRDPAVMPDDPSAAVHWTWTA